MKDATFENVMSSLYKNDGFTFSLNSLELNPDNGFSVAINKENEFVLASVKRYKRNVVEYKIKEYVDTNLASLTMENRFVGGWVEDGKLYLDIVELVKDKTEAEKLAKERRQEAFFDNSRKETIFVN